MVGTNIRMIYRFVVGRCPAWVEVLKKIDGEEKEKERRK
jgi:hypothetical protein